MGGGSSGRDVYAPIITSVNTNISSNSVTITSVTSDAARTKVYYSTSPIQIRNTFDTTGVDGVEPSVSGTLAPYDGMARNLQVVNITGLSPNTTYYYLVVAFDWSNNVSITQPASFHTAN